MVIVQCDGCDSRHLVADHLGWFSHVRGRTIEEILAEKGESVVRVTDSGAFEVHAEEGTSTGAKAAASKDERMLGSGRPAAGVEHDSVDAASDSDGNTTTPKRA